MNTDARNPIRDLQNLSTLALEIAIEAAKAAFEGYRQRPVATQKGRCDLVTQYDHASEALILRRLQTATPEIPIVAEESSSAAPPPEPGGRVWHVDPLDGTTNFVHGHPFWCVSIGLIEKDQPIAGAIVAPALDLRWQGHRGGGALRNGEACRVSDTEQFDDALIATGFPPLRDKAPDNNFDSFVRIKKRSRGVRRCGSAAIDLCMVADGTFDAYWERRLHSWDTIAGAAVVLAAGGKITSLRGGPPHYHHGHIAVSNGRIHQALLDNIGADRTS